MTSLIDCKSPFSFCPNKVVMVYGFLSSNYQEISKELGERDIQVFDCSLGSNLDDFKDDLLLAKNYRRITFVGPKSATIEQLIPLMCKNGLTNLIAMNCRRYLDDLPLIPIIFCVQSEDKKDIVFNAKTIFNRNFQAASNGRKFITATELRRAYKLCHDPVLPQRIKLIAQQTFKFVKVYKTNSSFLLKLISAPWKSSDLAVELEERKSSKISNPKENGWRTQLREQFPELKSYKDASSEDVDI